MMNAHKRGLKILADKSRTKTWKDLKSVGREKQITYHILATAGYQR